MADDIIAQIDHELLSWPGVTKEPGRFQSTAYFLGRREIGHIHGNRVADFMVPKSLRAELIGRGRVRAHQAGVSGGISYDIRVDDLNGAVALFRLNYDRLRAIAAPPIASASK